MSSRMSSGVNGVVETSEGGGGGVPRGGGGGTKELAEGNDGVARGAGEVAGIFFLTGCRESSKLPDTGTRWPFAYMHWRYAKS